MERARQLLDSGHAQYQDYFYLKQQAAHTINRKYAGAKVRSRDKQPSPGEVSNVSHLISKVKRANTSLIKKLKDDN